MTLFSACREKAKVQDIKDYEGPGEYFGWDGGAEPAILGDLVVASPFTEYNGTFTPKGDEFFYTIEVAGRGIICFSQMDSSGHWSDAKTAPFTSEFSDYDPAFSLDGSKIYFSSERPGVDSTDTDRAKLFVTEKTDSGWTEAEFIPLTGRGDYYSALTHSGNIYFNVWSEGLVYCATPNDSAGYSTVPVSGGPNMLNAAGDPFVDPTEDYMIFRGYGEDNIGQGDLYICFKQDTSWTVPILLDEPINSDQHEMCPFVTRDGKMFIYSSGRLAEDYTIKTSMAIDQLRGKFSSSDNGFLNIHAMSTDFIEDYRNR